MNILVTGGLGFIGSHTCVELLNAGHNVVIIDNLYNSKIEVLDNICKITNNSNNIKFIEGDLNKIDDIENIFKEYKNINAVIHFAGLKAVSESIQNPLMYYNYNIGMTLNLLNIMNKYNCKNIIFSSSATVYGTSGKSPVSENDITGIGLTNPYGKTKYFIEQILKDLYNSDNTWSIIILRYFNPVGAHKSGLIGEDPLDIPNNLMPYILKVANGTYQQLNVFGNNYDTVDGTCVRDFIHVVDLARGHIAALKKVNENKIHIYNLGTGKGTSVLELINIFISTNKLTNFRYVFSGKREGDIPVLYSTAEKAKNELNWYTTHSLEDVCRDGYNFCCKK